jgi:hypothetical protein
MTILEAGTEDTEAVTVVVEGKRVITAAMAVILSMMKMVIKATVLSYWRFFLLFCHSLELI